MLDPASIERLAEFPEQNDPLLNVALAEEGGGGVLLALARCDALGAEAIDVIAARAAREGDALVAGGDGGGGPRGAPLVPQPPRGARRPAPARLCRPLRPRHRHS